MPFLNEGDEPLCTVRSLYETAPSSLFEVVAIDDRSTSPKGIDELCQYPNLRYIRNKKRMGVDASRQKGIDASETAYVLIIDAHMRFKNDGWMERFVECMEREPETAWCTTCVGLGYGSMDMGSPKGKYYGADMLFVDKDSKPNRPAREVLEPKWAQKQPEVEYEIPCILGANYGFSRAWLEHIKGLQGLKMWGTSEPFLSLKTWMAGGKCKIRTDIEIGHKFRETAPYRTNISALLYNKIFLCQTILPEPISNALIGYLPKDNNFNLAMNEISSDACVIENSRSYYKQIFERSIEEYCGRFSIDLP